jgi:hypothetical protein
MRLGFAPRDARRLAAGSADLDVARRLVSRGCPSELALAILI